MAPKQTATADAILNKMRNTSQDDDSPKTQVAPPPTQEILQEKLEKQDSHSTDAKAKTLVSANTNDEEQTTPSVATAIDDEAQQVKYKARRYSKKDQLKRKYWR